MDVYLMIRRQKTTIFTDAKENTTILELKKMIQGILQVPPEDQRLTNEMGDEVYRDDKQLSEYNMLGTNSKAHHPASVGLALRGSDGEFEPLYIAPLSTPPELPEIMKQDSGHD